MAFTLIQKKAATTSANQDHVDITLDAPTTAGTLLVVMPGNAGAKTVSGATNGGDTFVQATGAAGTAVALAFGTDAWYILSGSGGKTAFVATYSGATTASKTGWVFEYSYTGVCAFDGAAGTTAAAGVANVDSGAPVTTTGTTGVVCSICLTQNAITGIHSGNEFTIGDITTNSDASAYLISSTAAVHTPQWDDSGATPVICSTTVAFKASGGASAPPIDDDVFLPFMRPVIPEPVTMVFS